MILFKFFMMQRFFFFHNPISEFNSLSILVKVLLEDKLLATLIERISYKESLEKEKNC